MTTCNVTLLTMTAANKGGCVVCLTRCSTLGSLLLYMCLMGLVPAPVSAAVRPTWRGTDLTDIFHHLSHSHLLLPLWVELPVHHHGRLSHRPLEPTLCRQLAHVGLILLTYSCAKVTCG